MDKFSVCESGVAQTRVKALYSSPVLRTYGRVADLTKGTNTNGTDTSPVNSRKNVTSSRLVKTDVVRVGTHPAGFGLYLFDYTEQSGLRGERQFGVMAEEVEAIVPEAVSVGPSGYKQVNYELIGIRLY